MSDAPKKSRSPDFDLCVLNPQDGQKGRIGAAWLNEDGSISIVLNRCVVLTEQDGFSIRLFRKDP